MKEQKEKKEHVYASQDSCRVCQNNRKLTSLCRACTLRYVTCPYCKTEHHELAKSVGEVRLTMTDICKACGPSKKHLNWKLLTQKNAVVVKDSYIRRRIS